MILLVHGPDPETTLPEIAQVYIHCFVEEIIKVILKSIQVFLFTFHD
jgi:hypothetical protein